VERAIGKELPGDTFIRHLATEMMEKLITVQREGKEAGFRIPLELIRAWSLTD
jgi:hypothetical protein